MKTPQTLGQFKDLINGMKHRERFVFDLKNGGKLEVYHTIKFESWNAPENICLTAIDPGGDKSSLNRLLHLWTDDYFAKIYGLLAN